MRGDEGMVWGDDMSERSDKERVGRSVRGGMVGRSVRGDEECIPGQTPPEHRSDIW